MRIAEGQHARHFRPRGGLIRWDESQKVCRRTDRVGGVYDGVLDVRTACPRINSPGRIQGAGEKSSLGG